MGLEGLLGGDRPDDDGGRGVGRGGGGTANREAGEVGWAGQGRGATEIV